MRPQPGDLISGKYRLVRLIGEGGMGSVYEARHEYLGTAVALKFVHPEIAQRTGLVARFLQEARLAASIRSVHIAHVTDVDQTPDGAAYLVMELLSGESLQSVLDRERRIARDLALDYTLQILAGLDAAHRVGAVHRDLKPDNVFIVPTPQGPLLKLLDFGIAKLRTSREFAAGLTRPGVMMGTPEYMAPEQAFSADTVDARADVYAVGVMLFEMLVGRRPVQGDDPRDIAARVLRNEIAPIRQLDPSIPEALAQVVHRAMAPMPEQRWASAAALRDALTPLCGALSLAGKIAATPSPPEAAPAVSVAAVPSALPVTPLKTPTDTAPDDASAPYAPTGAAARGTTAPMDPLASCVRGATQAQPASSYAQAAAYPAPSTGYGVVPAPVRRVRGGMSVGLVLALFGTAVVIVAVVVMLATGQPDKPNGPPPSLAPTPAAQNATPGPAVPTAATAAAILPPAAPPLPAATTHAARPARDAGASRDAGPEPSPTFSLPFPLPSQLPPLPSVLPPFPSSFPPFPFPFPGMPPAPSSPR